MLEPRSHGCCCGGEGADHGFPPAFSSFFLAFSSQVCSGILSLAFWWSPNPVFHPWHSEGLQPRALASSPAISQQLPDVRVARGEDNCRSPAFSFGCQKPSDRGQGKPKFGRVLGSQPACVWPQPWPSFRGFLGSRCFLETLGRRRAQRGGCGEARVHLPSTAPALSRPSSIHTGDPGSTCREAGWAFSSSFFFFFSFIFGHVHQSLRAHASVPACKVTRNPPSLDDVVLQ